MWLDPATFAQQQPTGGISRFLSQIPEKQQGKRMQKQQGRRRRR
jgi:hypothetical protein